MATDKPGFSLGLGGQVVGQLRPATEPTDPRPLLADLRERLDTARAHRRAGERERARHVASAVEKEARRTAEAVDPTEVRYAELVAVAGAAAVVLGLVRDEQAVRSAARRAFQRAVHDLRSVADALPEAASKTADLGVALAGTTDPAEQAEALDLLRSAIAQGIDDADVRRSMGLALLTLNLPADAVEALDDATAVAPDDWVAWELLATALERAGDPTAASVWAAAAELMWFADLPTRAQTANDHARDLNPEDWHIPHLDGRMHATAGRWEQAIRSAREADRLRSSGITKRLIAEILSSTGDPAEAIAELDTAIAADPYDRESQILKARVLVDTDRFDEALTITRALRDDRVSDAAVELLHGSALLGTGDLEGALEALGSAVELDPSRAVAHARLGVALAFSGRLADGKRHLDEALKLDPDDVWSLSRRADVHWDLGDRDGSRTDLQRALALAPAVPELYEQWGDLCARQGALPDAIDAYGRLTELAPDHGSAWARHGDLLVAAGRHRDALESYAQASRLLPDRASLALAQSAALVGLNDPAELPEAERLARRAIALDTASAAGHRQLARVLIKQDKRTVALDVLDDAGARYPQDGLVKYDRGLLLFEIGRGEDAIKALSSALALLPDDPDVLVALGDAYRQTAEDGPPELRSERLRRAAELIDAAVDRAAPDPDLLELIGRARLGLGEFDEAERVLREAVADPDVGVGALVTLGEVLVQSGKPAEAMEPLNRALERSPDHSEALLQKSFALLDTGHTAEAVEGLQQVLDAYPDAHQVRGSLADAYRVLGRFDDALREVDRALADGEGAAWMLATRGATLLQLERLAEAERDLRRAHELNPPDAFTRVQLTTTLGAQGRQPEATELLRGLAERYPDNSDVRVEYADALRLDGDVAGALSTIEQVAWDRPEDPWVLRVVGGILLAAGRHAEALVSLGRAAEIAPDVDSLVELADGQSRAGRLSAALSTIDAALAHERSRYALVAKAWMLNDLAAYDEAAAVAREAYALPSHDTSAARALGWALKHGGADPRQLVPITEQAAQHSPDDIDVQKDHADALWLLGAADAKVAYERAVELLDANVENTDSARHTKGWCLYRLRRYAEATEVYLRVLVTRYEEPVSLMFDIALAALEMGDAEHAAATYQRGLDLVDDADLRGRGWLAVGAFDLRQAVKWGLIAAPSADDLLAQLDERLARMPDYVRPEGASSTSGGPSSAV